MSASLNAIVIFGTVIFDNLVVALSYRASLDIYESVSILRTASDTNLLTPRPVYLCFNLFHLHFQRLRCGTDHRTRHMSGHFVNETAQDLYGLTLTSSQSGVPDLYRARFRACAFRPPRCFVAPHNLSIDRILSADCFYVSSTYRANTAFMPH